MDKNRLIKFLIPLIGIFAISCNQSIRKQLKQDLNHKSIEEDFLRVWEDFRNKNISETEFCGFFYTDTHDNKFVNELYKGIRNNDGKLIETVLEVTRSLKDISSFQCNFFVDMLKEIRIPESFEPTLELLRFDLENPNESNGVIFLDTNVYAFKELILPRLLSIDNKDPNDYFYCSDVSCYERIYNLNHNGQEFYNEIIRLWKSNKIILK